MLERNQRKWLAVMALKLIMQMKIGGRLFVQSPALTIRINYIWLTIFFVNYSIMYSLWYPPLLISISKSAHYIHNKEVEKSRYRRNNNSLRKIVLNSVQLDGREKPGKFPSASARLSLFRDPHLSDWQGCSTSHDMIFLTCNLIFITLSHIYLTYPRFYGTFRQRYVKLMPSSVNSNKFLLILAIYRIFLS